MQPEDSLQFSKEPPISHPSKFAIVKHRGAQATYDLSSIDVVSHQAPSGSWCERAFLRNIREEVHCNETFSGL
jgi:hypothetical protein